MAAVGLLLTLKYLRLYEREIKLQRVEQKRLAWERILKLMHQVAKFAALANISSVNHSRLARPQGFLPPQIAAKYDSASENLLSYWLQLKGELDIMPGDGAIDEIQAFIAKYDASADSRASEAFGNELQPITHRVRDRAEKSFGS